MMRIELNDVESMPAPQLRRLAAALLCLAGDYSVGPVLDANGIVVAASADPVNRRAVGDNLAESGAVRAGVPGYKIAPNDRPDVGADAAQARAEDDGPLVEPDPAQLFAGAGHAEPDPDPMTLFGAGNVAAASDSASSLSSASTDAGSSSPSAAPTTPGAGAVSGEQGNAAGGLPSTTPGGTLPAPSNGAATVGAPTPANGVDLDKHGLPWDGRIHAGTKTKNKDNSWKKKPKVDDALVAQVEAELRHMMSIKAPAGGTYATEQANHVVAGNVGATATPPAAVVPPPPPASAPGNVPPPPATNSPQASQQTTQGGGASSPVAITGFAQLLPAVTNAVAAGTLTEARVAEVLAAHGVQVLPQLAPRPDLVQSVAAMLFPAAQ